MDTEHGQKCAYRCISAEGTGATVSVSRVRVPLYQCRGYACHCVSVEGMGATVSVSIDGTGQYGCHCISQY